MPADPSTIAEGAPCDFIANPSDGGVDASPPDASTPDASTLDASAVEAGDAASPTTTAPRICSYPRRICGCTGAFGASTWSCVVPRVGCPVERPPIGSACVNADTCDYGCAFGGSKVTCGTTRRWALGSCG